MAKCIYNFNVDFKSYSQSKENAFANVSVGKIQRIFCRKSRIPYASKLNFTLAEKKLGMNWVETGKYITGILSNNISYHAL